MADDWIKARVDLHEQPETIGIATYCKLDVDTVVGKLLRVWRWADRVTTDGVIPHVGRDTVDDLTKKRGFADAMERVGWLRCSDVGIVIPNFERHNGKPAKRRALDMRLKSEKRRQNVDKSSAENPQNVRDLSASHADDLRTRGREEKEVNTEPPLVPPPENLDPVPEPLRTDRFRTAWADWLEHRKRIKRPLQPASQARTLAQLAAFGEEWAVDRIYQAIDSGWRGLIFTEDRNGLNKTSARTVGGVGSDSRVRDGASGYRNIGRRIVTGAPPSADAAAGRAAGVAAQTPERVAN